MRSPTQARELDHVATQSTKAKPLGNLNKVDPTTRVVGGVRERKSCFSSLICSKLSLLFWAKLLHIELRSLCCVSCVGDYCY